MGNAAKQESIRVHTGIQTEDNMQKTEEALAAVQQSERTDLETVQSLVQQPAVVEPTIAGSQEYGNTIPERRSDTGRNSNRSSGRSTCGRICVLSGIQN